MFAIIACLVAAAASLLRGSHKRAVTSSAPVIAPRLRNRTVRVHARGSMSQPESTRETATLLGVHRVLVDKVFPRQAEVIDAGSWQRRLEDA